MKTSIFPTCFLEISIKSFNYSVQDREDQVSADLKFSTCKIFLYLKKIHIISPDLLYLIVEYPPFFMTRMEASTERWPIPLVYKFTPLEEEETHVWVA